MKEVQHIMHHPVGIVGILVGFALGIVVAFNANTNILVTNNRYRLHLPFIKRVNADAISRVH